MVKFEDIAWPAQTFIGHITTSTGLSSTLQINLCQDPPLKSLTFVGKPPKWGLPKKYNNRSQPTFQPSSNRLRPSQATTLSPIGCPCLSNHLQSTPSAGYRFGWLPSTVAHKNTITEAPKLPLHHKRRLASWTRLWLFVSVTVKSWPWIDQICNQVRDPPKARIWSSTLCTINDLVQPKDFKIAYTTNWHIARHLQPSAPSIFWSSCTPSQNQFKMDGFSELSLWK